MLVVVLSPHLLIKNQSKSYKKRDFPKTYMELIRWINMKKKILKQKWKATAFWIRISNRFEVLLELELELELDLELELELELELDLELELKLKLELKPKLELELNKEMSSRCLSLRNSLIIWQVGYIYIQFYFILYWTSFNLILFKQFF